MNKREAKIFDIAKKFRNLKYKLTNFYEYQLKVNYKHILIVGDTHTFLGQEVINRFKETWQIANIHSKINDQCNFNLQIQFDDINRPPLNKEQVEQLEEKLKTFSKHYECVLFLPQQYNVKNDIKNESIFQEYEQERASNVEPAILASYLATKYLTNNGSLIFLGDYQSFSNPSQEQITYGLAQNQINLLNLNLGDRELISVDSFTLNLLQNEKQEDQEQYEKETKQIANYIKKWADGLSRPISGTYVKFNNKNGFVYPELL
ncbi:hypothetical protein ABPG74_017081 [Tetrahymena malaccensis]